MAEMKSMEEAKYRVIRVLNLLGCLRLDQVEALNYNNVVSTGVAKQLTKEREAFYSKNKDRLLQYPWVKPNKAITDCVDVLLKFLINIEIENIYKPSGVTTVGFTRNNKDFEIVFAKDKKELLKVVEEISKEYNSILNVVGKYAKSIKYIIAIRNEELAEFMPKKLDFNYAFAVVNWFKEGEKLKKPEIYFLTPDEELEEMIDE